MTTFFVTCGALIYTDQGGQIGYEDVFMRLARFRQHVAEKSLDPAIVEGMIR